MLDRCTGLEPSQRQDVAAKIGDYANQSLRTLVLAHRSITPDDRDAYAAAMEAANKPGCSESEVDWDTLDAEGTLKMDLLVGIEDPLRAGVPAAVLKCQRAGITVRMVTGDNEVTAAAIARQCGILPPTGGNTEGVVITGRNFREKYASQIATQKALAEEAARARAAKAGEADDGDGGDDEDEDQGAGGKEDDGTGAIELSPQVKAELQAIRVMARSSPEDKLSLVRLYKAMGDVVGVTGDGINDAPALSAAHVGLAMNICGTDVAKDASDIIIMDDNFR